jgi:hypothetical protein
LPLVVTSKQELSAALQQHERPVVISKWWLALLFIVLHWVQDWAVLADMVSRAISVRYQVEYVRKDWLLGWTSERKMTLTPTRPPEPQRSAPINGEE